MAVIWITTACETYLAQLCLMFAKTIRNQTLGKQTVICVIATGVHIITHKQKRNTCHSHLLCNVPNCILCGILLLLNEWLKNKKRLIICRKYIIRVLYSDKCVCMEDGCCCCLTNAYM